MKRYLGISNNMLSQGLRRQQYQLYKNNYMNLSLQKYSQNNINQFYPSISNSIFRYSFSSNQSTTNQDQQQQQQNQQQQEVQNKDEMKVQDQQQQQQQAKTKSKYQQELEKRYPKEKIEEVQQNLKNQKINLYEYLMMMNKDSKDNYLYTSDILLNNKINHKYLKDDPKQLLFILSLWSGVGYLSTFVSTYLTILPVLFGLGGFFSYMAGRNLVHKTIEKIEFVPNEIEKVRIHLIKGKEPILCRIDNIEVIDVMETAEHPYISDKIFKDPKNLINLQKDISITINVEDLTGQTFNALNLVIFGNKELTQVCNYNLLKTVLEGDILMLNKFKVQKQNNINGDNQELINAVINDSSYQKVIAQNKQSDQQIDEIEQQIQQEISRFSKKKNN